MARLPTPGSDDGKWGEILNEYLSQSHTADGGIKAGAVTKTDVGLGNVDNTSDTNKPISTAAQTALDAKLNTVDLQSQAAAPTIGQRLTKNIGGSSDITLVAAETQYRHIDLVGATQSLIITVPTGARFMLTNSTDYAQTIKKTGATGSISLDAGSMIEASS